MILCLLQGYNATQLVQEFLDKGYQQSNFVCKLQHLYLGTVENHGKKW